MLRTCRVVGYFDTKLKSSVCKTAVLESHWRTFGAAKHKKSQRVAYHGFPRTSLPKRDSINVGPKDYARTETCHLIMDLHQNRVPTQRGWCPFGFSLKKPALPPARLPCSKLRCGSGRNGQGDMGPECPGNLVPVNPVCLNRGGPKN